MVDVFDENNTRIKPFNLPFYFDLHIFCTLNLINENNTIESFPNYYKNRSFICTEQFELDEIVELGINIYKKNKNIYQKISSFYYFNNINCNFSKFYNDKNDKFSPFKIQKEYIDLKNGINTNEKKLTLKSSYIQEPSFILKTKIENNENKWLFKNIYNNYYCFCKGIFCHKDSIIFQNCKYFYFLFIIDKFRNLYEKTEYLLADFVAKMFNDDDILPIFERMIKQNLPAHYMTKKKIYT